MVHAFTCNDVHVVLDVNSGAVHQVDELAYEIVRNYKLKSEDQIVQELSTKFLVDEVNEALEEVKWLEQNGFLFTEYDYSEVDIFSHEPVIKAMCLHVAHDCNLRCKYCFASTGDFNGQRSLMSEEVGKKALDFLVSHSGNRRQLEVDFFGGEPLMNFEVMKAIVSYGRELEKIHNKHFKFTVTTNGLELDDQVIDYLNEEMDNVVISIDGRESVHNHMRKTVNGKDSFRHIITKALKLADSRDQKRYYIRGTFTRENLDFTNDVIALSDLGFEQISLEPVVANASESYSITEEHLPTILAEYEKLAKIYTERRKSGKWFNFFHFFVDLEQGPCIAKKLTGCGAGNEYVAVTPEGDIYPCHQFVGKREFIMGSVMDGSFASEMQTRFRRNHVLNKEKCSKCWAKFYCSGGCPANAYQFNGDISEPYTLGCEMEKKRLECALAIYVQEREDKL